MDNGIFFSLSLGRDSTRDAFSLLLLRMDRIGLVGWLERKQGFVCGMVGGIKGLEECMVDVGSADVLEMIRC
ncbi:uncharacterized protein MYCFIDRAFT_176119 [Pseudocercospora fijiensis CIRAD86]|uniref:Uncharacterized protein n=1 Tax=Pseudocercospora fijiensis (strain CIRAD86) TaxID=383855 RepID=M3AUD1_PSEFD|nr:uncharacterized protein MYCFIDRAFT_176119 [Pseudocercospora fijiensis CIRAD86]EME80738.1 hypothetical protein MYCFIDRAFT_176119 [Pseudocercospora fijiensis CIRAD86]